MITRIAIKNQRSDFRNSAGYQDGFVILSFMFDFEDKFLPLE
jgi:hypothetical protein